MSKTCLIFHSVVLIHHLVTIYHMNDLSSNYMKYPAGRMRDMLKMGPRYFTSWNIGIQTLYFAIALLLDLARFLKATKTLKEWKSKLTKFNGYLYNVIMFPTTLLVFIAFWGMFSIKRDWVLPQQLEDACPIWLNSAIHTTIIPVLIGELFVYVGDMPRPKFKTAMIISNFFLAIYTLQYLLTYYSSGKWIYGIFYDINNWTMRGALMLSNFVVLPAFLKMGYCIQNYKNEIKKKFA